MTEVMATKCPPSLRLERTITPVGGPGKGIDIEPIGLGFDPVIEVWIEIAGSRAQYNHLDRTQSLNGSFQMSFCLRVRQVERANDIVFWIFGLQGFQSVGPAAGDGDPITSLHQQPGGFETDA